MGTTNKHLCGIPPGNANLKIPDAFPKRFGILFTISEYLCKAKLFLANARAMLNAILVRDVLKAVVW